MFGGEVRLTFAAVLPHPQVHFGHVVAAAVAMGKLGHAEHVLLDSRDVVAVVAEHARQRRLLQLCQLGRREHARVLVPEPRRAGREGERDEGQEQGRVCG